MTGRERILAALSLEQPDRVPLFELAYNEPSIIGIARHFTDELPPLKHAADMTPEELIMLFNALALFIDELDIEGVTARALEAEQPLGDGYFKNKWDITYKRNPFGLAFPMDGPIKSPSDLNSFTPPKIDPDIDLMMLGMARGRFGNERAVSFSTHDCFVLSWQLRGGIDRLLVDYIDNPQLAHDLARMSVDYHKELVALAIDAGADAVTFEDDIAFNANTLMSPAQFDEFIGQYQKELVDLVHRKGAKAIKHTDGNIWPILDRLIDIGFDGIHPLQPQAGMDLKKVKQHCGDKVCLMGNIDCVELLPAGTEEEVEQAVKQAIEDAASGGGYIMSSSNTIHPGCKPENYIAMVRAARKYGKY
ncbi:MAG: uroporphyrinogen decarboxylase family protein [Candidatus Abyssubacteria bacterium]